MWCSIKSSLSLCRRPISSAARGSSLSLAPRLWGLLQSRISLWSVWIGDAIHKNTVKVLRTENTKTSKKILTSAHMLFGITWWFINVTDSQSSDFGRDTCRFLQYMSLYNGVWVSQLSYVSSIMKARIDAPNRALILSSIKGQCRCTTSWCHISILYILYNFNIRLGRTYATIFWSFGVTQCLKNRVWSTLSHVLLNRDIWLIQYNSFCFFNLAPELVFVQSVSRSKEDKQRDGDHCQLKEEQLEAEVGTGWAAHVPPFLLFAETFLYGHTQKLWRRVASLLLCVVDSAQAAKRNSPNNLIFRYVYTFYFVYDLCVQFLHAS